MASLVPPTCPVTSKTRVFLVDDHPLFVMGLRARLGAESDLEVCGEAAGLVEALAGIAKAEPDVVVTDLSLGRESGLDLLDATRELPRAPRVVVLSMHDELLYAEMALQRGAVSYVMKSNTGDDVLHAVRSAARGGFYVSAEVNARLLQRFGHRGAPVANGIQSLSPRELEVFKLMGLALSTKNIAHTLHISAKTVETHRTNVKEKLGLSSNAELIVRAATWLREQ